MSSPSVFHNPLPINFFDADATTKPTDPPESAPADWKHRLTHAARIVRRLWPNPIGEYLYRELLAQVQFAYLPIDTSRIGKLLAYIESLDGDA